MRSIVAPEKITEYLLNATHPTGAPKARFFLAAGFSTAAVPEFSAALLRHPQEAKLMAVSQAAEGRELTYQCDLALPGGQRVCIRSFWMQAGDSSYTRLITSYPFG